VDVAQDLVITEDDCGTSEGLMMSPLIEGGDVVGTFGGKGSLGRVVAEDVLDPANQALLLNVGSMLDETAAALLEQHSVDNGWVRSVITCKSRYGVCAQMSCYGRDLWGAGTR
jgi:DNA-directed RNA polymerase subunit beta'